MAGAGNPAMVSRTPPEHFEAQQKGVETFCITVDKSGHDYLKKMCPDARYLVLNEIEDLPDQLSKVYTALTVRQCNITTTTQTTQPDPTQIALTSSGSASTLFSRQCLRRGHMATSINMPAAKAIICISPFIYPNTLCDHKTRHWVGFF